jgi:hypothetical protein
MGAYQTSEIRKTLAYLPPRVLIQTPDWPEAYMTQQIVRLIVDPASSLAVTLKLMNPRIEIIIKQTNILT